MTEAWWASQKSLPQKPLSAVSYISIELHRAMQCPPKVQSSCSEHASMHPQVLTGSSTGMENNNKHSSLCVCGGGGGGGGRGE